MLGSVAVIPNILVRLLRHLIIRQCLLPAKQEPMPAQIKSIIWEGDPMLK